MTIAELIGNLIKKFPAHAKTIEAWEHEYRIGLKGLSGEVLADAYNRVMLAWGVGTRAAFPKPADFKLASQSVIQAPVSTDESMTARLAYLKKNLEPTALKCAQDALDRCEALNGQEVAESVRGYVKWHARRIANQYVQRRFLAETQNDDKWLKGARWKFTDTEIAELKSRAETRAIFARQSEMVER